MPTMANYADGARTPRTLTEREQRALLKATGEHRAGFRLGFRRFPDDQGSYRAGQMMRLGG